MRFIFIVFILLDFFWSLSYAQTNRNINISKAIEKLSIDTLLRVPLKGTIYNNNHFTVLKLCDLDSKGYWIDSSKRIELVKGNQKVASFSLPIPDIGIKNFSVDEIQQTKTGFIIVATWGGGNDLYGREFHFIYKNKQFYFYMLMLKHYSANLGQEIRSTKKIAPLLPVDKFNFFKYLKNE